MNFILRDDESGQFILLMGIIVAIGLVIILIFFNQSMMAGHSSAQSIMDFPKDDIRDFRTSTVSEAIFLAQDANNNITMVKDDNPTAFNDSFNPAFNRYVLQLKSLYAREGTYVDVSPYPVVNIVEVPAAGNKTLYMGSNATINLYYNNGETSYDYNSTIYFE